MNKIILLIFITALMPALAFSQNVGYGDMDGGWHMMHDSYVGIVMWLLLIIVIGLLIYLATQLSKNRAGNKKTQETPFDILKKRYATGEINKEEFERIKQDLQS